ncbi:ATP-binding cassette domain-containing protein [Sulfidibacter corallicola]|uniref:ATP-binding cassette domain-containing protein n=1 Tax=Sulfidibacter corallicola TaxID=2818388 RepID=A0A8A4TM06_SULCO|nr:ABC transporter ATP-binding protein [Sulfidibacter corallicola]QTD50600.1 ATP-binding cassette domain-containing protein [Sulfidibacter corallicola]
MPDLDIKRLQAFGRDPIDVHVGAGECLCVVGPSGSGKSLLLRAIADLDPNRGDVFLDGRSRNEMSAPTWRRLVGFLPTESRWWFETVGEHFDERRADDLADLGFAEDVWDWQIHRLSTGERQRLALLRLMAHRPKALLLDEPTASLDEDNKRRVETVIARYRKDLGAPVLWVSHEPAQIERVSNRRFHIETRPAEAES